MVKRRIKKIYEKYQVPKSLQKHMLQVAGLSKVIVDSWQGELIDKDAVVNVCIYHDIAKPMKFDLAKQAQFGMSEKEIEKLRILQEELKRQYGEDEHKATLGICKEIGFNEKELTLLDNLEWEFASKWLKTNDIESLIPIYCDMRIGFTGIMRLKQRMQEQRVRTKEQGLDEKERSGLQAEKLIQENVGIDLNKITVEDIDKEIESLLAN